MIGVGRSSSPTDAVESRHTADRDDRESAASNKQVIQPSDATTCNRFDGVVNELLDTYITWASEPIPRIETLDLLTLSESETSAYIHDIRIELASMRETLHVAVGLLADSELRNARLRERLRPSAPPAPEQRREQPQQQARTGTGPAKEKSS